MGETNYLVPLGDDNLDRYRLTSIVEKTQVTLFLVQYEAMIDGEWRPILRYDTAHGFPHRDLIHPDGRVEKTALLDHTNAETLTNGQDEIRLHWRAYRERYEREMKQ
jgi:hypothetical protein